MLLVRNSLKELLENKGVKQSWLAERCSIHRGTMNNIIMNKYNTSLEVALKIAKVLDVRVDDIFELVDDENNLLK